MFLQTTSNLLSNNFSFIFENHQIRARDDEEAPKEQEAEGEDQWEKKDKKTREEKGLRMEEKYYDTMDALEYWNQFLHYKTGKKCKLTFG